MPARTPLFPLSELPVGASRCIESPAGPLAVFHTPEGVFALDNTCPHRGGPLSEGPVQDGRVACPWHQWLFDLKTGQCPNIPGAKVKTYPLEIANGTIHLAL